MHFGITKNTISASTGIIIAVCVLIPVVPQLNVIRCDNNKTVLSLDVDKDETFSIKYNHSVNRSSVIDTIEWTGRTNSKVGNLMVVKSLYQTFGAGIPIAEDGGTLVKTPDGLLLDGINTHYKCINLITGTYADHYLLYRDMKIQLKKIVGEQTLIRLEVKNVNIVQLIYFKITCMEKNYAI